MRPRPFPQEDPHLARTTRGAFVALLTLLPALCLAQTPVITIQGLAFDSLHGRPLAGATISMPTLDRSVHSDSAGHFTIDSVPPGTYRFVMAHQILDSIGVGEASATATVTQQGDTVRIVVPTFASLWTSACHTPVPVRDTGLLVGMVRDVDGMDFGPDALISASWLDMSTRDMGVVTERRWRANVRSDSTGGFILCGVPMSSGVRLFASSDSAATGIIDLLPLDPERILRVDLRLSETADSARRGIVTGVVTGEGGQLLSNVRVVADGVREVRTGNDGKFVLRSVPLGTQQIEVRAIGLAPTVATVDVTPTDTARVNVSLSKVTVLDSVHVIALAMRQHLVAAFEERRKSGWGTFADSSSIGKHSTLLSAFAQIPSVQVNAANGKSAQLLLPTSKGGQCVADLWIDRIRSDYDDLNVLRPDDIAAFEVYKRASEVPPEFLAPVQASADQGTGVGTTMRCGAVVVWTKRIWP